MKLAIFRHAEAEARSPSGRDAARAVGPRGRRRFERAVRGVRKLGLEFDLVLHSPWLRAVETADLLAPAVRGAFRVTPHLVRAPTAALLGEMRGRAVAVVGHEPWLSALAALLVTGSPRDASRFPLGRGGMLLLEGAPAPGTMVVAASFPPRALRRLGR